MVTEHSTAIALVLEALARRLRDGSLTASSWRVENGLLAFITPEDVTHWQYAETGDRRYELVFTTHGQASALPAEADCIHVVN